MIDRARTVLLLLAALCPTDRRNRWAVAAAGILLLWIFVIAVRTVYITAAAPERFLDRVTHRHTLNTIPAMRGRILDEDGTPLAWSTRHLALTWKVPETPQRVWEQLDQLRRHLDGHRLRRQSYAGHAGETITLVRNIEADVFPALAELAAGVPELRITSYFVRHYYPDPAIRRKLGSVTTVNGIQIGVNGLERTHDNLLRGRPGMYSVALDKNGRWIADTWQQLNDFSSGYDVYLSINVPDR